MKKIIYLGGPALLAASMLASLLPADVLKGALGSDSKGSVSSDKASIHTSDDASGSAESRKGNGSLSGNLAGGVDADRKGGSASTSATMDANGNVDHTAMHRLENQTDKVHRDFARRLNKVEAKLIETEKKTKRWTRDELQERRDRINAIRDRLRKKGDKAAAELSKDENAKIEADVKAEEDAMASDEKE